MLLDLIIPYQIFTTNTMNIFLPNKTKLDFIHTKNLFTYVLTYLHTFRAYFFDSLHVIDFLKFVKLIFHAEILINLAIPNKC